MCGRFTLRTPANLLVEQFMLDMAPPWQPRYNIAPTQTLFAVRKTADDDQRHATLLRWGLVPSWAKDVKMGSRLINARADTIAEKPSFRSALKKRRCLVLADGYYEWRTEGKRKQPFYIRMEDEQQFAFAGLWESWRPEQGAPLETCTLITTEANELTRSIHDRMPVILNAADHDLWLDPTFFERECITRLLVPFAAEEMKAEPVSSRVNSVKNDDAACLAKEQSLL
jgi:putative SOS response-associated peptidase YedK